MSTSSTLIANVILLLVTELISRPSDRRVVHAGKCVYNHKAAQSNELLRTNLTQNPVTTTCMVLSYLTSYEP